MRVDHQHYIASGGDMKQAQHFNCITEPIFYIPISQVYCIQELFRMITEIHVHAHSTHVHTNTIGSPTWASHNFGIA